MLNSRFSFWHALCLAVAVRVWCFTILLWATSLLQAEPGREVVSGFPIQYREGMLWVDVRVPQAVQPLRFILDSGASVSVLSLHTARQLGLPLGRSVPVLGVCAKLTGNWPVRLPAKAGTVQLPSEFLAVDLSKLSSFCNNAVDGLIGADFFRNRVVQIDYQAQQVRLLNYKPSATPQQTVRLQSHSCGLRARIRINDGQQQWIRLDTGCATPLQWVTSRISTDRCPTVLAVGLSEFSIPQTVARVSLGGTRFDDVATGLHRSAIVPDEAGLLGNGLLARFGMITIDCPSGRLILGRPDG